MTGTADTEAEEFAKIYKLDVVVVPTNRPLTRIEEPDLVYKTEAEKFEAIVGDVLEKQNAGRPVLVGTVSVEKSERLSGMLRRRGVKHVVLNAKYHAQEAEIVAQAGRLGTVTVATNMAGRGTDILLGGNAEFMARQQCLGAETNPAERLPKTEARFVDDDEFVYFFHIDSFYRVPRSTYDPIFAALKAQCDAEHDQVVAAGGLHIVGTERHESRRIDNQLRGRAGRQGDPGSSRFYLSLEDDLMRIFGTGAISGLMERLGMEDGVPIEHNMVTKAIARAQKQVEAQNFSMRKHLLEYDDVMNKQRENVYTLRRQLLESRIQLEDEPEPVDTQGYLMTVAEDLVATTVDEYCPPDADRHEWDVTGLTERVQDVFGIDAEAFEGIEQPTLRNEGVADVVWTTVTDTYHEKEAAVGQELFKLPEEVRPQLVPAERLETIAAAPEDERLELAGRAILEPISRSIMLQIVDAQWKDHLYSLDHLKEGIGLRGYGQRDPLVEYKKESFTLFQGMKGRIDEEMVRYLWRLRPVITSGDGDEAAPVAPVAPRRPPAPKPSQLTFSDAKQNPAPPPSAAFSAMGNGAGDAPRPARVGGDDAAVKQVRRDEPKVGRNDPCPCGSGKKYKKCHGANQ
jgi:preprotein translocase subunit SecA